MSEANTPAGTPPRLLGGRYEVGSVIGRGGMADVHAGYDTRLSRPVAIKLLRSDLARDTNFLARFRREAQSAAGLNHPSIVAIYDSGEEQETDAAGAVVQVPYMVMERIDGSTLRERLVRGGPLSPDEAARITEGVLAALAYSHRMGIVHRDIKPANVMLTSSGEVKVMDFGIARAVADSAATMTQTQAVIGTAQYLSPEQAQGRPVDARSDLYSAGCLLFELLTGRTPFVGESPVAIAYQHVGEPATPPSRVRQSVPAAFDAVVLHAMAKDREARYQSAIDFRADLVCAREGRPVSAAARATLAATGGESGRAAASTASTTVLPSVVEPATRAEARARGAQEATSPVFPIGPRDADLRARRRRGPALLGALVGVIVLALVAYLAWPTLFPPKPAQVSVPHVVGQTESDARQLVQGKQLVLQVVDRVVDATNPPDTVIEQDPKDGTLVVVGATVRVKVSAGPGMATVPSLVGQNKDAATTQLRLLGFAAPEIVPADDPSQPKDAVVKVDPAPGTVLEKTRTITLTIASGKVKVPQLVGKFTETAQGVAETTKLVYQRGEPILTADPNVIEGTVLAQDITADTLVDQGTKITVRLAVRPTATTTVTYTPPPTSTGATSSGVPTTSGRPTRP